MLFTTALLKIKIHFSKIIPVLITLFTIINGQLKIMKTTNQYLSRSITTLSVCNYEREQLRLIDSLMRISLLRIYV